jgi:hypothetical protein
MSVEAKFIAAYILVVGIVTTTILACSVEPAKVVATEGCDSCEIALKDECQAGWDAMCKVNYMGYRSIETSTCKKSGYCDPEPPGVPK